MNFSMAQSGTPTPSPSPAPGKPRQSTPAPKSGERSSATPVARRPVIQPSAAPKATPDNKSAHPFSLGKSSDDWDQQAFMQTMTPEQRLKFRQNLERWKKLPPEQQTELRKNEEFRRKRILGEINEAIRLSGLTLDGDQRQLFTFKYAQERRTIEENLRKEMETKRRTAVDDLLKQLVAEFRMVPGPLRPAPGSTPHPGATATPTASPAPTAVVRR